MVSLARARAHAHRKHGGFALMESSVSWKMALALQRAWEPQFSSILCNQQTKSFVWEKTDVISIAENCVNEKNSRDTVVLSVLQFGNHVKKFDSNFQRRCSFLSESNLKCLFVFGTMYERQFNAYCYESGLTKVL